MGFPLRTNSGSTQNLWGMRDYGFRGLWDKRASTVVRTYPILLWKLHPYSDRTSSRVLDQFKYCIIQIVGGSFQHHGFLTQ